MTGFYVWLKFHCLIYFLGPDSNIGPIVSVSNKFVTFERRWKNPPTVRIDCLIQFKDNI